MGDRGIGKCRGQDLLGRVLSSVWNESQASCIIWKVCKEGGRAMVLLICFGLEYFWLNTNLEEKASNQHIAKQTEYFPGLNDKELPRYVIVSDFSRFRIRIWSLTRAPSSLLPFTQQSFFVWFYRRLRNSRLQRTGSRKRQGRAKTCSATGCIEGHWVLWSWSRSVPCSDTFSPLC